jgi:hypothetical protein
VALSLATEDGRATGLLRENAQDIVEVAVDKYQSRLTPEENEQVQRERVRGSPVRKRCFLVSLLFMMPVLRLRLLISSRNLKKRVICRSGST